MQGRLAPLWGTRTLLPCSVPQLQSEGKSTLIASILGAAAGAGGGKPGRRSLGCLLLSNNPSRSRAEPGGTTAGSGGGGETGGKGGARATSRGGARSPHRDRRDPVPPWGTKEGYFLY